MLIVFAPFLIQQIWFYQHTNRCIAPSVHDWAALSYAMLKLAGLNYFEKAAAHVQPADFVELDYHRSLEFITEITFDKAAAKQEDHEYEEANP